jgi:hypothetical protein
MLLCFAAALLATALPLDVAPFKERQKEGLDRIVASDFLLWRECARKHVEAHPGTRTVETGTIAACLSPGRRAPAPWHGKVEGEFLHVYGKADIGAAVAARRMAGNGATVGRAIDGMLRPVLSSGDAVQLPSFVPEGALVGVSRVGG